MIWYLMTITYYGAATYSPKAYQVQKTCQEQAEMINAVASHELGLSTVAVCVAFER